MDDLDRLFHHLVDHLAGTTPDRLQKPFQVSELYQRLVPYRVHRRELGFESIEDYEMAILRLLAGENGYASVEPPDVQEALAAEARQVNPDPGAFREFAAASVVLNREAIGRIVNQDAAYAPPDVGRRPAPALPPLAAPTPEPRPAIGSSAPAAEPPPAAGDEDPTLRLATVETRDLVFEPVGTLPDCPHCEKRLPTDREAVYCPYCGERLATASCRECGESVEPGWRYCLACGAPANWPRHGERG